jgi:hypothetical protein
LPNDIERYLAEQNVRWRQNTNVHETFRSAFGRQSSGASVAGDHGKLIGVL